MIGCDVGLCLTGLAALPSALPGICSVGYAGPGGSQFCSPMHGGRELRGGGRVGGSRGRGRPGSPGLSLVGQCRSVLSVLFEASA